MTVQDFYFALFEDLKENFEASACRLASIVWTKAAEMDPLAHCQFCGQVFFVTLLCVNLNVIMEEFVLDRMFVHVNQALQVLYLIFEVL